MKRRILVLATLMLSLAAGTVLGQLKKRIAVFSFENKSRQGWSWYTGGSPGDGMADMLITELVKSGKYMVIERSEIAKIMQEQDMGMTGRVTEQSAAKVGKLLGVELAVMGAITEFGASKGGTGGRLKGIGIGVSKQKATVAIDVRIVNTNTGEILAAENVRKDKSKGGLRISTPKGGFRSRTDFDRSLAGKATRECIESIMELLENQIASVPWEGKVILVRGTDIYIKPGSSAGVKVGDVFHIYSEGEALIDPDTGLSLGSEEVKVGTIVVQSLVSGGKAAKAVAKSGSGFTKGHLVRMK
ncbi:hypothetical protein KAR48_18910 [bacterium]|nr:hypothetical protein [bacterium]